MSCPVGVPVTNVMAGQVTFAGYSDAGYGYLVVVENSGVQSFYGHLSQIDVQVGQVVDAGTVVGATGNTGRSTGPHLHWEVRVDGTPVNPLQGIPGNGGE
jgi:murein DD-endopeptidase MepM/ murein hydrolase activator NlpD